MECLVLKDETQLQVEPAENFNVQSAVDFRSVLMPFCSNLFDDY